MKRQKFSFSLGPQSSCTNIQKLDLIEEIITFIYDIDSWNNISNDAPKESKIFFWTFWAPKIYSNTLFMNYPAFFARNLLQTHSRSLQNPKPCPIQIFTHLNTGTSRRDKKDKWLSVIRGEFFFGGGRFAGRFEKCSISSPPRVQIDRELVRLITLIGLNKFSTHITSSKSLKKFSRTTFRWSVVRKCSFLVF